VRASIHFTLSRFHALTLSLVCAVAAGLAAQTPTAPPDPQHLAGQWRLNKDLSTLPKEPEGTPTPGGSGPGNGGGNGSGGRRGGGFGGGFGGRGGFGGGGRNGGEGNSISSANRLKMMELRRVLSEPADLLTIVVSPGEVSMTDERGGIRRFKTDNRKETIDFGPGARIDTKTHWDGETLAQEFDGGPLKATATYQLAEGRLLTITIQESGDDAGARSTPIKYVYERPKS
jgi:hypothetical protein